MIALFRSIFVLLLAVFLLMAGAGTLGTLVSMRLASADAPTFAIGVISALYFIGLTLGSLFAYKLVLGVGHIRTFSALAAMLAATALGHALHLELLLWGALRLVAGFCMAGLFICVESWLNQDAVRETRGQILAFYTTSLYVGQGTGQFLLNLDDGGFVVFAVTSMLLSLALVPVALTRMAPPALPAITGLTFRQLYAASPLGVFGTLISGIIMGALYGLAPVYAQRIGLDVTDVALFMSAIILGGAALQWPLGRLSDIFDRRLIIIVLFAALVAVSLAMLAVQAENRAMLIGTALAFGGVAFALYPLCVAHTNDHLETGDMVAASGGLILAYSLGAVIGPLGASAAMSLAAAPGLFLFTCAIGTLAVAIGLWRMVARPPVPSERQARYRALPGTTPIAVPLDPRMDDP